MELRALHILDKYHTTRLHPQPDTISTAVIKNQEVSHSLHRKTTQEKREQEQCDVMCHRAASQSSLSSQPLK